MRSAIAVLTAGVVLVACGSAGPSSTPGIAGGGDTGAPVSTASVEVGDTTIPESPTTSVDGAASTTTDVAVPSSDPPAPAATAAPPAPATAPPAPPATAAPGLVGDTAAADPAKSWWFVGTEEGDPEAMSDGVNCGGLYEAQALGSVSYTRCGPWESFAGSYMWTVVRGGVDDRFQAIVWQQTTDPFTWIPKMKLVEPAEDTASVPSGWASVQMAAVDVDSGPAEELMAGVKLDGTGGFLYFDVIDVRSGNPRPVATVHDLDRGHAAADVGVGVAFYTPINLVGEPNCCPTTWSQFLLTITVDGWGVVDGPTGVPSAAVPLDFI